MLATWLDTFFGKAVTSCLLCVRLPLCLSDNCAPKLSSSHNSDCHTSTSCLVTVVPPILPAWLLANQHFIKNNTSDRIKDHCPTALKFWYLFIFILSYGCFAFMCVCLCITCLQFLWKLEESVGSPGAGITDSCKPPCRCWEANLGPLKE